MIEAKNIHVQTPEGAFILEDVSINIIPGQITAVVGKNGAGKSTLLKAISGDVSLHSGDVHINQAAMRQMDLLELARIRAIISQKIHLNFAFKVREVVSIGRSPFSGYLSSNKDREIAEQCLEKVDALHLINRSYTTLSGGEQQRVHFARALAQIWEAIENEEPSYLLLDEPLASLDVAHQHEMMFLLKQLARQKVAVFIVIHDLNLAAQYTDSVHILKNGKTVTEDIPAKAFTEEIVESAFDYPVNIIPHPKIECPLILARGK